MKIDLRYNSMRKYFYILGLVATMMALTACSGGVNKSQTPVQTVPANKPVETSTAMAPAAVTGACRLALLLPGLVTGNSSLQTGVKEAATQAGCQVDIYAAENQPENMAAQINAAGQKKIRGMIIKPIDHTDVETAVQQSSKLGIPVIVIGADGLPGIQTNRVVPDFVDGARKAAGFVCGAIHEHGNIVQLADSQIDGADGRVSKAFSASIQSACPEAKLTTVRVQGSGEDAALVKTVSRQLVQVRNKVEVCIEHRSECSTAPGGIPPQRLSAWSATSLCDGQGAGTDQGHHRGK